jgi:hypothetical protein
MKNWRPTVFVVVAFLSACATSADTGYADAVSAAQNSGPSLVEAELTFHRTSAYRYIGVRMLIRRDGMSYLDRTPGRLCQLCVPQPFGVGAGIKPVHVIQLDSDSEPEVVFDLFSGGAHCCIYSYIYRYDPARELYVGLRHDFRDFGYRFVAVRRGGPYDLSSFDARFAYKFGCFLCSRFPPQVWAYLGGRLLDVTRRYPRLVRRDLRREQRIYDHWRGRGNVRPALAALVADRCLLGKCHSGFRLMSRALERATSGGRKGMRSVRQGRNMSGC